MPELKIHSFIIQYVISIYAQTREEITNATFTFSMDMEGYVHDLSLVGQFRRVDEDDKAELQGIKEI